MPHLQTTPIPLNERAALRLHGEAESYSGLGVTSLYKWAKRGEITMIRAGGRTLVLRDSLDRFLAGRPILK